MPGRILRIGLALLLWMSLPSVADELREPLLTKTLSVWTPGRSRSHYRDQLTHPFVRKLHEVTGRRVSLNGTADYTALERACAEYSADHVLVDGHEGLLLAGKYGYRVIAYGEAKLALYRRAGRELSLEQLSRIGFIVRSNMDVELRRELGWPDSAPVMQPYRHDQAWLGFLFNDELDAVVTSVRLVEQLVEELQAQLALLYPLKTPGRMIILVSPYLDDQVVRQLQELYFSDDELVQEMVVNRAGMTLYRPERLPAELKKQAGIAE